ncbi:MAG: hypothetical protein KJO54_12835 [Gammaproteobacteria bacterium]|nr:hypothetical protein [Gammaproteobacteria bacterium]NNF61887.1 hypothetical protein [Gammaproteobacteria bacterium]NNM19645.1 hypothetical protein [Gammaproteobacteria bacterium]
MRLLVVLLLMAVSHGVLAESKEDADNRLACDGTVALFYGEELIWHKTSSEIREMDGLVQLPGIRGFGALPLRSLLHLRPDIVAIEFESCRPRHKRFERAELESGKNELYFIATNYRGFKLGSASGQVERGKGMKNIGRIVLVPASQDDGSARPSRSRRTDKRDKAGRKDK